MTERTGWTKSQNRRTRGDQSGRSVSLQILHVPDCPNVAVLVERLSEVAPDWTAAELEVVVVNDYAEAQRLGMCGSPTLLVDGADPFADPLRPPSLSCRLYADPDGTVSGAPSLGALRAALRL